MAASSQIQISLRTLGFWFGTIWPDAACNKTILGKLRAQPHRMQQRCALPDQAMEESLHEIASLPCCARLSLARGTILYETTILNVRHLLEKRSAAERMLEEVSELFACKGLTLNQDTIVRSPKRVWHITLRWLWRSGRASFFGPSHKAR